jgi:ABC-type multidrug transport system ATPase subunit
MAPAVSLRDAVTLAGRFPLLAGVSLDVAEGEIVRLAGPNGAGKSSLLRLCCGLAPLRSGHGRVLGHDLATERRAVRLLSGYLAHETLLYDELTVEENLVFALRSSGSTPSESRRFAEEAMERLGLAGRLPATRLGQLSAGQRRRAAIAAVLARRPRLWLLDEPHAGLDDDARGVLDGVVLSARRGGATVIFASHDAGDDSMAKLADRVVHLAGGRVIPAAHAEETTRAV